VTGNVAAEPADVTGAVEMTGEHDDGGGHRQRQESQLDEHRLRHERRQRGLQRARLPVLPVRWGCRPVGGWNPSWRWRPALRRRRPSRRRHPHQLGLTRHKRRLFPASQHAVVEPLELVQWRRTALSRPAPHPDLHQHTRSDGRCGRPASRFRSGLPARAVGFSVVGEVATTMRLT
jgi:hypothetical protein